MEGLDLGSDVMMTMAATAMSDHNTCAVSGDRRKRKADCLHGDQRDEAADGDDGHANQAFGMEPAASRRQHYPDQDCGAVAKKGALDKQCGICLSPVDASEGVLGCAHSFCFTCIQQWARVTNRCPLCRRRFSSITSIERRRNADPRAAQQEDIDGDDEEEDEEEIEVITEIVVSDRDAPSSAQEQDSEWIDPLDEESEESDDSSEYSDSEDSDDSDDDEWLLAGRAKHTTIRERKLEREKRMNESHPEMVRRRKRARRSTTIDGTAKEPRLYPCEECGRVFKSGSILKRHLLVHTKQKDFACTECDKRFARKQDLKRHFVSHASKQALGSSDPSTSAAARTPLTLATPSPSTTASPSVPSPSPSPPSSSPAVVERFACDHPGCGRSFTLRNNLARHRKVHREGFAGHPCAVCGHVFAQATDLKRHMNVHSDVRPFACHLCPLAFRQKAHLATHLRSKAHAAQNPSPSSSSSSTLSPSSPFSSASSQAQAS